MLTLLSTVWMTLMVMVPQVIANENSTICECTSEYNISLTQPFGTDVHVEGYCNKWRLGFTFCFLRGGLKAANCSGAKKSSKGDFYYSNHPSVCIEDNDRKDQTNSSKDVNCRCGQLDKYSNPYPYCEKWLKDEPPFCFLDGGSSARDCPGARKWRGKDVYITSDETVCNASLGNKTTFEDTYCNCTKKYDLPPYCGNWKNDFIKQAFCVLNDNVHSRDCPGAVLAKWNEDLFYFSTHSSVCQRSAHLQRPPIAYQLSFRKPLNGVDILYLILDIFIIVSGTVGNVLVIKYFLQTTEKPGSRFVIALAVVDILRSVLVPISNSMLRLYDFEHNPFGKYGCYILTPIVSAAFYIPAWLIVVIALERAGMILFPYKMRNLVGTIYVIAVTITVSLLAIALRTPIILKRFFVRTYTYASNTAVYKDICSNSSTREETFLYTMIVQSVGLWLPMVIIVVMYSVMFVRLRNLERKMAPIRSTSAVESNKMTKTTKIFLVTVFVFYICCLPLSIMNCIYFKGNDDETFNFARNLTIPLANINSCLNPFVYSKFIQDKILSLTMWTSKKVRTCSSTTDVQITMDTFQPQITIEPEPNNGQEIIVVKDGNNREESVPLKLTLDKSDTVRSDITVTTDDGYRTELAI